MGWPRRWTSSDYRLPEDLVESWQWQRQEVWISFCILKRESCSLGAFQATWCNDPTCQTTRCHNPRSSQTFFFPKIWEPPQNSTRQKEETWNKLFTEGTQILGVTAQNVVATATWRLGFVHPCITQFITRHCHYPNVEIPSCWKWDHQGNGSLQHLLLARVYYPDKSMDWITE